MIDVTEQETINQIFDKQIGSEVVNIKRMKMGICNEVFDVETNDKNHLIVRLNKNASFLEGSDRYIPLFESKGIKVPKIISSDYSLENVPFAYQILSKIDGDDLGNVILELSEKQLINLAKEISQIFDKLKAIPTDGSFGWVDAIGHGKFSSWTEFMQDSVDTALDRGKRTGVMDKKMEEILQSIFNAHKVYFKQVESRFYYDDICSKNVMVKEGQFSGLVDLDGVSYGDYLEAIGRIKASWYGTEYGKVYTDAIEEEQHLPEDDRLTVTMYALMHRIFWLCENGIQFNQNTSSSVDWEKAKGDKEIISAIYSEYQALSARIKKN